MAHGSPKKEVCFNCESYGLTPRFSISICPKCGNKTTPITNKELRTLLNLMIGDPIPIGFQWIQIK